MYSPKRKTLIRTAAFAWMLASGAAAADITYSGPIQRGRVHGDRAVVGGANRSERDGSHLEHPFQVTPQHGVYGYRDHGRRRFRGRDDRGNDDGRRLGGPDRHDDRRGDPGYGYNDRDRFSGRAQRDGYGSSSFYGRSLSPYGSPGAAYGYGSGYGLGGAQGYPHGYGNGYPSTPKPLTRHRFGR